MPKRSAGDAPPIFLFVSNLSKFRDLRNEEDDFGFGGSSDKPPSPGKMLSNILSSGPAIGVHRRLVRLVQQPEPLDEQPDTAGNRDAPGVPDELG